MAGESLVIVVFYLLFNTIIAMVVSSHAKKNGQGGYFWIVFLFGILGVLLYVADAASSSDSKGSSEEQDREAIRSSLYNENKTLEEEGAEVAISTVYDYLKLEGEANSEYFIDRIHPIYPAGFSSEADWWENCVSPQLKTYSGVEPPTRDRETWVHRPTLDRRKAEQEKEDTDKWITAPGSGFMHREIGTRARGLFVEVSDEEKNGNFFVKNNLVTPESYMVAGRNGDEWVDDVSNYLLGQYEDSK